jgi:16S rRNA (guanine527-N7)-methyltransferase
MRKTVQIKDILKKELVDVKLNRFQFNQIDEYLSLLQQWNKKINLTAVRQYEDMFYKHILDVLVVFSKDCMFLTPPGSIVDLGSGAGLPGLIISIIQPEFCITSVDKIEKKITFQQICKSKLKLNHFNPISGRIEDLLSWAEHNNNYDYITSRAFTQIQFLLFYGIRLLKQSGKIILWKGEKWQEEYEQVSEEIKKQFYPPEVYIYRFNKVGGTLLCFKIKSNNN